MIVIGSLDLAKDLLLCCLYIAAYLTGYFLLGLLTGGVCYRIYRYFDYQSKLGVHTNE